MCQHGRANQGPPSRSQRSPSRPTSARRPRQLPTGRRHPRPPAVQHLRDADRTTMLKLGPPTPPQTRGRRHESRPSDGPPRLQRSAPPLDTGCILVTAKVPSRSAANAMHGQMSSRTLKLAAQQMPSRNSAPAEYARMTVAPFGQAVSRIFSRYAPVTGWPSCPPGGPRHAGLPINGLRWPGQVSASDACLVQCSRIPATVPKATCEVPKWGVGG